MIFYRALRALSVGDSIVKQGEIFSADRIRAESIALLEQAGKISELHPPPMNKLPGWSARAKMLKRAGYETVQDFLAASDTEIAAATQRKHTTVARWRSELLEEHLSGS